MRLHPFVSCAALCASLALLAACTTVPETGRSQLLLVPASEALQMSLAEFDKLKKNTPISHDAAKTAQLERVGRRIAAVAPLKDAHWEFVLFDKPDTLNAFALPGGKVGVYTGILQITQTDAGLATVLGHEIAHAVARHGQERMSEGLLMQLGGAVLAVATQERSAATQQALQAAYGLGGTVVVALPHSRSQELEADHLGLLYMARAGYDPREAVEFWKRFAQYNKQHGGGKQVAFLSTHPVDEKRIAQLQELLPQAQAEFQRAKR